MNAKLLMLPMAAALLIGGFFVVAGPSDTSTYDAYVRADATWIAPKIAGHVAEVLVQDHQRVQAGQPLVRLDDRDYRVALRLAEADVTAALAAIANLQAMLVRQDALIEQTAATIRADSASLNFAQASAERYLRLSRLGAVPREEQEKASSELQHWIAVRERDRAARTAASKEIFVIEAQIDQAKAALARAEAVRDQAALQLSYTEILAPFEGTVGARAVTPGAYVAPGNNLLAVVPLAELYVTANFRETEVAKIHAGQPVTLRIDALPDVELRGHVDSLAPATGVTFSPLAPDNATGNFTKVVQRLPVKIVFEPGQPALARLRVGMSVVPTLLGESS
ncbi:HlyD family secretion protein [Stutzerimonas stutzeri]|uniref:DSBA oxidoreductase n=1 Tax=Stutzerimonas stutzeri KOS6 TaxID=1218352 RepID=A0A061JWF6_STUST|nr:HlyD family secretion protein [Stutzerimonas stutzeri]EWC43145.1 DSBA oxidoreductase [Stutzerimonas stutzeri KOS6]